MAKSLRVTNIQNNNNSGFLVSSAHWSAGAWKYKNANSNAPVLRTDGQLEVPTQCSCDLDSVAQGNNSNTLVSLRNVGGKLTAKLLGAAKKKDWIRWVKVATVPKSATNQHKTREGFLFELYVLELVTGKKGGKPSGKNSQIVRVRVTR